MAAELIRVGLIVDATQAQQGVRQMGATLEAGARQVDLLRDRLHTLTQNYRVGAISALEYSSRLRTLKADMQELAAGTRLGVESQHLLTTSIRQTDAQLRQVSGGMNRAIFGVQALAIGMQGGRVSAQGLVAALTTLGIGSPAFLAITAGLALIATLMHQIGNEAEETGRKIHEGTIRGLGEEQLKTLVRRLELQLRGPEIAPGVFIPGSLSPSEATDLANARAALADIARSRTRGQSGSSDAAFLAALVRNNRANALDDARSDVRRLLGASAAVSPEGLIDPTEQIRNERAARTAALLQWAQEVDDIQQKYDRMIATIENGLGRAFESVLARQRSLFGALFDWVEAEIERLLARAAARSIVQAGVNLLGLGSGFLAGFSQRAPVATAPVAVSPNIALNVNVMGQSTREVVSSTRYELDRAVNLGGRASVSRNVNVPVAGVVVVHR